MKRSKRYATLLEKSRVKKTYPLKEAIEIVKETATAKFNESVEISMVLGVNPKKSDQMVRGSVSLPNGTGKERKVLVFAVGDKEKEAKEAGADYIGGDEYVEKIKKGWIDFDAVVAQPEMMPKVGKLGRILGPRGLMPNPKTGTVTNDVGNVVKEIKKGKVDFKVDKTGNIHSIIGKVSFTVEAIFDNLKEFISEVIKVKPSAVRGTYIKAIYISSTMGPGMKVDISDINNILR